MQLKGAKILITGAGGFIGSHLVERLTELNCDLTAFVHYNGMGKLGCLEDLPQKVLGKIDICAGDIRDFSFVRSAVKGKDVVFHLAALIGIPYSYSAPESYIDTNVKGTLNILDAAKEWNVKKIIITSTSEVYGTARRVPIDEMHPRQAQSPYSASKIAADAFAESYARTYGLAIAVARPFNTYGPRQSARAVIPAIVIQALCRKHIKTGALNPTRDFVFVKDTVEGFIAIAESDAAIGHDINICTKKETSVGDLANLIASQAKSSAKIIEDKQRLRPKNSEVERLLGDNSKIQALTGWKPRVSLEEGIRSTISWFQNQNNLRLYRADRYTI